MRYHLRLIMSQIGVDLERDWMWQRIIICDKRGLMCRWKNGLSDWYIRVYKKGCVRIIVLMQSFFCGMSLFVDCFIVYLSYIYSIFMVYLSYIYSMLKVAVSMLLGWVSWKLFQFCSRFLLHSAKLSKTSFALVYRKNSPPLGTRGVVVICPQVPSFRSVTQRLCMIGRLRRP